MLSLARVLAMVYVTTEWSAQVELEPGESVTLAGPVDGWFHSVNVGGSTIQSGRVWIHNTGTAESPVLVPVVLDYDPANVLPFFAVCFVLFFLGFASYRVRE